MTKDFCVEKLKKGKREKEENIWRRKISFCKGEGKGGKYLEKENIFCVGE